MYVGTLEIVCYLSSYADHVKLEEKKEDLGDILNGDRLLSGPCALYFLVDMDLEILCRKKLTKDEVAQFRRVVDKDYYFEMYAHDEETVNDQEETGWKYTHGDVFRFLKHKSLFAATLGCGAQLFTVLVSSKICSDKSSLIKEIFALLYIVYVVNDNFYIHDGACQGVLS
ncbi:hypothetical protein RDI58_007410 [Solanum bulbocastanum]|uniref:Transmembrane 9 superfamily member n=1 Tax=Solanum bulbocastanum TaxID=147425 RepID=A0AAN8U0V4_SOLBU